MSSLVDLFTTQRHDQLVQGYSSREVERMTGASYRQIDYWAREGYISGQGRGSSTGSGRRRQWTDADVHRVRLLLVVSRIRNGPLTDALVWLDQLGTIEVIEQQIREIGP